MGPSALSVRQAPLGSARDKQGKLGAGCRRGTQMWVRSGEEGVGARGRDHKHAQATCLCHHRKISDRKFQIAKNGTASGRRCGWGVGTRGEGI